MRFVTLALVALGIVLGTTPAAAQKDGKKPKRQADLITQDEIEAATNEQSDAYSLIQHLRPSFLRARASMASEAGKHIDPRSGSNNASGSTLGSDAIKVIVNGTVQGDIESLRQLQSATLKEIQYLSMSDATTRFGTGFTNGAIVITTK